MSTTNPTATQVVRAAAAFDPAFKFNGQGGSVSLASAPSADVANAANSIMDTLRHVGHLTSQALPAAGIAAAVTAATLGGLSAPLVGGAVAISGALNSMFKGSSR